MKKRKRPPPAPPKEGSFILPAPQREGSLIRIMETNIQLPVMLLLILNFMQRFNKRLRNIEITRQQLRKCCGKNFEIKKQDLKFEDNILF